MRRENEVYKSLDSEYTAWERASKLFRNSNYIDIKPLALAETLASLEALTEEGLIDKGETGHRNIYRNKL